MDVGSGALRGDAAQSRAAHVSARAVLVTLRKTLLLVARLQMIGGAHIQARKLDIGCGTPSPMQGIRHHAYAESLPP
jgi:hypothetical protein